MSKLNHLIWVIWFLYVAGDLLYTRLVSAPTFLWSELILAHSTTSSSTSFSSAMLRHSELRWHTFTSLFTWLFSIFLPLNWGLWKAAYHSEKARVSMSLVLASNPSFTVVQWHWVNYVTPSLFPQLSSNDGNTPSLPRGWNEINLLYFIYLLNQWNKVLNTYYIALNI